MQDVIQIEDQYYILATSDRAADCTRVLKEGETFAILDCHGDIQPLGMGEQGIFHEGTRYLSKLELRFAGIRPLLLGSAINKQNELLSVDLMNPDFMVEGEQIRRDSIHVYRTKFIWKGKCFEQLRLTNFSLEPLRIPFSIQFAADFADIFEVRGNKRKERGKLLPVIKDASGISLSYAGLDDQIRTTRMDFSPAPMGVDDGEVQYLVDLEPKDSVTIQMTISCQCRECESFSGTFEEAYQQARVSLASLKAEYCDISTDNGDFNLLLARSQADLLMMTTDTPHGKYPYAGVPWFSTTFGRDGIITALEVLWANPGLARGVLSFLARTQATVRDAEKDAEPGKIIHETRLGEMAALGEVPFGLYYGSVDSTPLFIVLAGAYYRRTGDKEFIARIWNNIVLALQWIDTYGDADGDGFVEYARHSHHGLLQQGWKDSNDSVFHADGTLAEAPIALCEVQGYVYDAKISAAMLARILGDELSAERLGREAAALKQKFNEVFWCDDLGFYALALDGQKRPCRVRSSNAGHCLFSGIAGRMQAEQVADQLLSEPFYSGWGVRTIANTEKRYNPMSYHNGSIWPHDNALVAYGVARYGFTHHAILILEGIFNASLAMDLHRLPELYCGFKKREDLSPILYPLACAPQAWAAASTYLLLQGCMGLEVDGAESRLRFTYPILPPFLNEVEIRNLVVGNSRVDVTLRRYQNDVAVNVLRKEGAVEVVITK